VKLIDFGSATVEPRNCPDYLFDKFMGTIHAASPEILRGEKYRGRPTDIWALGVLLVRNYYSFHFLIFFFPLFLSLSLSLPLPVFSTTLEAKFCDNRNVVGYCSMLI